MAGRLLEVCVDSIRAARLAAAAGAHRLELCAGLAEGGVTPGPGTLATVLEEVAVPVVVLARPRPGGFVHDAAELAVLRRDVAHAREAGAAGVALGVLRADGTVDREETARLVELARPLAVTFHRAFDATRDALEALDALLELGIERVLSSGHAARAIEGADELARLVARAGGALEVVAGGGVRAEHAAELLRRSGVRALHSSARAAAGRASEAPGPEPGEVRRLRELLEAG